MTDQGFLERKKEFQRMGMIFDLSFLNLIGIVVLVFVLGTIGWMLVQPGEVRPRTIGDDFKYMGM